MQEDHTATKPNYQILGGSAVFILLSLCLGLSEVPFKKEAIFLGSLSIIGYLMRSIMVGLDPLKKREILSIALIIFIFRAMPTIGAGASWWQIDVLGFVRGLSLAPCWQISSLLAIVGLLALRSWMSRRPNPISGGLPVDL